MPPLRVFVSYSRDDHDLAGQLLNHLAPLRQLELIEVWSDRLIEAGHDWNRAISERLDQSHIALMLISSNFFASEYSQSVEVRQALAKHEAGTLRIIPILLSDVEWAGTRLANLQALPVDGVPIERWENHNQALRGVAKGIRSVAESLQRAGASEPGHPGVDRPAPVYYLNHTSFLRPRMQAAFRERTKVPLDHYDIRVVVDANDERSLDRIGQVEYQLDPGYPEPIQVRTDRSDGFLLKEIANGEFLLRAKLSFNDSSGPISLERYITLWKSGPRLPGWDRSD